MPLTKCKTKVNIPYLQDKYFNYLKSQIISRTRGILNKDRSKFKNPF